MIKFFVMPNHFHCIVQNKWTDPHICPDYDTCNEVGANTQVWPYVARSNGL